MAFDIKGLSKLSGADGFTLWFYRTADPIATINTAAYFTGDAVNMLGVRDLILVSDTNVPTMNWVIVLSNDGTTVDVSDGQAITEADAD